jgi:alpha-L-fucosidase
MHKNRFLTLIFLAFFVEAPANENPPVLPSKAQLEWADSEIGVLIHFDMPVFEPGYDFRKDWNSHPDLSVFNPKELNTDQWIKASKAAGATYAVLVAKHCSGFSLWPTKAHPYSVKNTPWRNGQGDIVKDFIASCKKFGLKPGIYASTTANGYLRVDNPGRVVSGNPQDQKKYNEIVKMQLTELWSEYGKLAEVWFDGGVLPPEKGGFDVLAMLRKFQPEAIAFQGPFGYENNIRWVGNEEGVAPYPCWSRADSTTSASGVIEIKGLNGNPNGLFWCPGESDFPLRLNSSFQGGWFWHKDQDDQLRSLEELTDKYSKSVGRNTNMLLGIVVDNRGLVPDTDVKRLEEFGKEIAEKYTNPKGKASGGGKEIVVKFIQPQQLSSVVIKEDISKGERIREYRLSGMQNGVWQNISKGTCIGHKRIETVKGTYEAIKLTIDKSEGQSFIKELACYQEIKTQKFEKGSFGYDLHFLQTKDDVIVLKNGDAQVIVSPKYQGKVFTSTAMGLNGSSSGWINYKALSSGVLAPHINAYGGEDRMWLGPEGGQYSIFFKPGTKMVFENWQTPAALDSEPWDLVAHDAVSVSMKKELQLQNYSETRFKATLSRQVRLMSAADLSHNMGIIPDSKTKWVGFETENTLKNTGTEKWTREKGTVNIWMLAMLTPSESGVVVIPYTQGDENKLGKVATTNYFGEIPADRIKIDNGTLYFKVDGKHRSKLGLSDQRATSLAGSYDPVKKELTILQFTKPTTSAGYINQLWEIQKEPFKGDVINSYNDGPLADGTQMGPFYEIESSSPAALLAPGESLTHTQRIFHFVGNEAQLSSISQKLLGVSIEKIKTALAK